ncbi:MAG: hydroxymethylbilane synthase [Solirubrobacterales bacterium]|nr:hydroxymethylbilane synthase [Solirubrobacterales bacterium]
MAAAPLRLGTRASALALAQARTVADRLDGAELVEIRTSGEKASARREGTPAPTEPGGDKARFVGEIELALLAAEVDLGVHSAKDLPADLPQGLTIAGVPEREQPLDAFVGAASSLGELAEGARVGTSSLRRRSQLLALRPDLELAEVRGNVDTRLRKLGEGDYDGLVLAAAGLRRLGRESEISFLFDPGEMTPAAGQGALALEARSDDERAMGMAATLTDRDALAELSCERAAVSALGASCDTPVGILAEVLNGRIRASAFCGLPDGSEWIRDEFETDASYPEGLGRKLAERMKLAGAGEILERAAKAAASEKARR